MHLILIIAAGILLAFILLPYVGLVGMLVLSVLVVIGIICGVLYSVGSVHGFFKTRQDKKEQRRKCLESLSEEERAAELEKGKEQHKLMQKGSLMIIVACLLFGGIGFAVYFLVNALLN